MSTLLSLVERGQNITYKMITKDFLGRYETDDAQSSLLSLASAMFKVGGLNIFNILWPHIKENVLKTNSDEVRLVASLIHNYLFLFRFSLKQGLCN